MATNFKKNEQNKSVGRYEIKEINEIDNSETIYRYNFLANNSLI